MKKFTSYTDESGIVKKRKFIVATVIVNNSTRETFEQLLESIETESGKRKKWTDVGVQTRIRYTKLLLKKDIFNLCTVFYSVHISKEEYVTLVSSQVAKSILAYADNKDYKATILLDRVNKKMTENIKRELKQYRIRYRKINALDDTNNVGLKFIDTICGLIRDIENKDIDESYKTIFKKLKLTS